MLPSPAPGAPGRPPQVGSRPPGAVVRRLAPGERLLAREACTLLQEVFEAPPAPLDDGWLDQLLDRRDFWLMVALDAGAVHGALTAHALPMTRAMTRELFVYDLAVRAERQRQGIGRALLETTRVLAARDGLDTVFVAADLEDDHAIAFYGRIGGVAAPATIFTWAAPDGADA